MKEDERRRLEGYLALTRDFVSGRTGGPDFRAKFLDAFKKDETLYAQAIGDVLMRIFDEAECYAPDPKLLKELKERDPDLYVDEKRLREKLAPVVPELEALLK